MLGHFNTDARHFGSRERRVWANVTVLIDPYRTRVQLHGNGCGSSAVCGPHRVTQTKTGIVSAGNHFIEIAIAHHRQYRTKLLISHQRRIIGNIANDSGVNKIAWQIWTIPSGNNSALSSGLFDKSF